MSGEKADRVIELLHALIRAIVRNEQYYESWQVHPELDEAKEKLKNELLGIRSEE